MYATEEAEEPQWPSSKETPTKGYVRSTSGTSGMGRHVQLPLVTYALGTRRVSDRCQVLPRPSIKPDPT
jgi:hypothetical protein